jgi:hypothetical protein
MPKIRLRAPRGTDEANSSLSPVPYKVGLDGFVEVDQEAVEGLLARGGFTLADVDLAPPPVGMVRMAHSDPHASCSFNGVSYSPGADGFLMVPAVAASALEAHGFVAVVSAVHDEPEAPHAAPAEAPKAAPEAPAAAKADPEPAAEAAPTKAAAKG